MEEAELREIERYITSGNGIPVERATVPASVLRRLLDEIRAGAKNEEAPQAGAEQGNAQEISEIAADPERNDSLDRAETSKAHDHEPIR